MERESMQFDVLIVGAGPASVAWLALAGLFALIGSDSEGGAGWPV